jgi:hypothetical protein
MRVATGAKLPQSSPRLPPSSQAPKIFLTFLVLTEEPQGAVQGARESSNGDRDDADHRDAL